MAAGGTGGHVYPAIAIADALKELEPDTVFLFVGTKRRMEWETVPAYGYKIRQIWISGFHRRLTPQNLLFPVKDRKSTRLNSSHVAISYAVFCLKKKNRLSHLLCSVTYRN